jgi:hypothetical protein
MVTKVCGSRIVLAVAVFFFCLAGRAREANALKINVPYVVNGKALTAMNGTAGSAVWFNNMFYFAYIAPDGNLGILADSNGGSNGQNVVSSYEIKILPRYVGGGGAAYGTALVSYNGTLYVFYLNGFTDDGIPCNTLVMMTSTDGVHWSQEYFVGFAGNGSSGFATPPTAVVWDGNILVYLNEETVDGDAFNGNLVQFNVVGTATSGPYRNYAGGATYSTSRRPSAAIWQGRLCLAFADASNGNDIGMVTYTDATGWTAETLSGLYGIPSIFPLAAGALQLIYVPSNDHLYSTFTSNGASFTTPQEDTASTSYHAAIPFSNWNLSSNWTFYVGENNELFTVLE